MYPCQENCAILSTWILGYIHARNSTRRRTGAHRQVCRAEIPRSQSIGWKYSIAGRQVEFRGKHRVIYAKCEQLNLTGSIKDRIALHMLWKAYSQGGIHPGDTIVEATSGNTGISFAAFGLIGSAVVLKARLRLNPKRTAFTREDLNVCVSSIAKNGRELLSRK